MESNDFLRQSEKQSRNNGRTWNGREDKTAIQVTMGIICTGEKN